MSDSVGIYEDDKHGYACGPSVTYWRDWEAPATGVGSGADNLRQFAQRALSKALSRGDTSAAQYVVSVFALVASSSSSRPPSAAVHRRTPGGENARRVHLARCPRYWSYHLARSTFFAAQGAASDMCCVFHVLAQGVCVGSVTSAHVAAPPRHALM